MAATRTPRKVHHKLQPPADPGGDYIFGRDVSQEVDFLIELMDLETNEAVLDVASGAGRHALELARRGFGKVTAIDLSDQLLEIGRKTAEQAELELTFQKGDPRKPAAKEAFDAAIVLGGGAFGLMDSDAENLDILEATFAALKPGGRIALSAMNLLFLLRQREDLSGFDPQTNYLTTTERVHVMGELEGDAAEAELLPLSERYYVFPGLRNDLSRIGFKRIIGFGADTGNFSSRAIGTGDPQILMYAQKPA